MSVDMRCLGKKFRGSSSCLYRDGVRFVLVQGGEPLLRRDLPEILEDLSAIGFHLTLITNGTKITASLVERLGRLPVAISVSLDTLDREKYRRIRGADQLAQVLEGIALLQDFPHPKFLTCIVSEVESGRGAGSRAIRSRAGILTGRGSLSLECRNLWEA